MTYSNTMILAGYKSQITRKNNELRSLTQREQFLSTILSEIKSDTFNRKTAIKTGMTNKKTTPKDNNKKKLKKKLSVFVDTNYGKNNRRYKQMIRVDIVESTKSLKGDAISLSGKNPIMEKAIHKINKNIKFTAIEKVSKRHSALLRNVRQQGLDHYICVASVMEIGTYIKNLKSNKIILALLDYCCTITNCYNDIRDIMIRNVVKKNGVITLTFSARNKGGKSKVLELLDGLIEESGWRYERSQVLSYNDTSAMYSCIIKRIK